VQRTRSGCPAGVGPARRQVRPPRRVYVGYGRGMRFGLVLAFILVLGAPASASSLLAETFQSIWMVDDAVPGHARLLLQPELKYGELGGFALSPDGRTLAYERTPSPGALRPPPTELHVAAVDGRGDKLLIRGRLFDPPGWTPDGSHVTYVLERVVGQVPHFDTWMVPLGGGAPSKLRDDAEDVVYSADGSRLAFSTLTVTPSGVSSTVTELDLGDGLDRFLRRRRAACMVAGWPEARVRQRARPSRAGLR
jgi:hypothetical protein